MPERSVQIPNPSGLHARPARVFSEAAAEAPCDVTVVKEGREVNAKSVLSVLTLDCHQHDEILIRTEGPEEDQSLARLVKLIESGLGEL